MRLCRNALPELLGESDQKSFGATDVAEPIRVFVLNHFADELRTTLAEPGERLVDVLHGEHDAQVTESVHRGVPVIGDDGRREESRELEPTVAVRGDHHGDLDALGRQPRDAPGPLSLDRGSPFELQAKLGEECDGGIEGFYHDAYVVHPRKSHPSPLIPDRNVRHGAATATLPYTSRPSVAGSSAGRSTIARQPAFRASHAVDGGREIEHGLHLAYVVLA